MLFPTFTFVVFFLVVWPLNWITMPRPHRWRVFMICASYVFYAWWDWRFAFLLAASTVANQFFAVSVHRSESARRRKVLLAAAIAANLGVLAYFKYWNFFAESGQDLLGTLGVSVAAPLIQTILPVGISFFTFMALSYVIDAYRGDFAPTTLGKFAVFLSFFPHLVAGPIVRPSELVPQFSPPRDPRRIDTGMAFWLITRGLFKKVVIATAMARYADPIFAAPKAYSSLVVLVAIYAYAVQIYADFSGYTDMAIGVAMLLGFKLPDNFNRPYDAVSIRDFWRRWHMTLSRWLRDYVYIPLGGNRRGERRTYVNLMATMLIGGLWHGAAWTFIAWAAIHGTGLAFEHWREDRRRARGVERPAPSGARRAVRVAITFNIVCAAWVFFRAPTFTDAFDMFAQLVRGLGQPSPQITAGVLAAIAAILASQWIPSRPGRIALAGFSRSPWALQGCVLAAALVFINLLGPAGVAPFIYFQF